MALTVKQFKTKHYLQNAYCNTHCKYCEVEFGVPYFYAFLSLVTKYNFLIFL